jgi:Zn-dependent protease
MTAPDLETIADRLMMEVQQVMSVGDVTVGGTGDPFRARFRGQLRYESDSAFDRLAPAFQKEGVKLMIRVDGAEHVIFALPEQVQRGRSSPWLHLGLFILTFLSVLFTGLSQDADVAPQIFGAQDPLRAARIAVTNWHVGLPYAASLMGILLAHEFGHYFAARRHGTDVSLPFFIPVPFPFSVFGTLGAAILFRERPRDRRALLDIGIAGPLAGLALAVPLLILGLTLSPITTLPEQDTEQGFALEGNSIFYLGLKYMVKGELLPEPTDFGGVEPAIYWIRYFAISAPAPFGGRDVLLHPVAWAGWAGLLVTALNLLPIGMLDGGHNIYALFGRRAGQLRPIVIGVMFLLGFVWLGWWLFAVLSVLVLRAFAIPMDEITELDRNRRILALSVIFISVLLFTPVPLIQF